MDGKFEKMNPPPSREMKRLNSVFREYDALTINFENFIFPSVYYTNFYYTECVLNFLSIESNNYLLNNEFLESRNLLRTLLHFRELVLFCTNLKDSRRRQQLQLSDKFNKSVSRKKNTVELMMRYCRLMYDNHRLEQMNTLLLDKLHITKRESNSITDGNKINSCSICLNLTNELEAFNLRYRSLSTRYKMSQIEKERMVMQYAKSEKQLIDSKR